MPDAQLVPLIQQAAQLLGTNRVALLGEPSDGVLRDLTRQLPRIGLAVTGPAGAPTDLSALPSGHLLVITPSAWERLPLFHRWHPAVLPLPLGPARGAIGALAREQGWVVRES